ncbi:sensory box histidine kinase/response regulator [Acetobacter orientalis]|uniref:Sensory box histidine kinase/response regulator n=1 Tax=Acetobacter orientalis TaxID=146474 RepID=A0A2Z5ZL19_9PROT|nr:sensory box histidine kinase/response regulator [Acetobacter orientalis]
MHWLLCFQKRPQPHLITKPTHGIMAHRAPQTVPASKVRL